MSLALVGVADQSQPFCDTTTVQKAFHESPEIASEQRRAQVFSFTDHITIEEIGRVESESKNWKYKDNNSSQKYSDG